MLKTVVGTENGANQYQPKKFGASESLFQTSEIYPHLSDRTIEPQNKLMSIPVCMYTCHCATSTENPNSDIYMQCTN